jgi:CO dehydrogenase/acetyl-CoA synthase beta subunit
MEKRTVTQVATLSWSTSPASTRIAGSWEVEEEEEEEEEEEDEEEVERRPSMSRRRLLLPSRFRERLTSLRGGVCVAPISAFNTAGRGLAWRLV